MTDRIWLISRCSVSNTLMTRIASASSCGWEAVRRSEPRGTRTIGFVAMRTMETEGHGGCKLQLRIRQQTSDSKSSSTFGGHLEMNFNSSVQQPFHDTHTMLGDYADTADELSARRVPRLSRAWQMDKTEQHQEDIKSSRQARVHMLVDSIASMGFILLKHFSAARMQCPSHK